MLKAFDPNVAEGEDRSRQDLYGEVRHRGDPGDFNRTGHVALSAVVARAGGTRCEHLNML